MAWTRRRRLQACKCRRPPWGHTRKRELVLPRCRCRNTTHRRSPCMHPRDNGECKRRQTRQSLRTEHTRLARHKRRLDTLPNKDCQRHCTAPVAPSIRHHSGHRAGARPCATARSIVTAMSGGDYNHLRIRLFAAAANHEREGRQPQRHQETAVCLRPVHVPKATTVFSCSTSPPRAAAPSTPDPTQGPDSGTSSPQTPKPPAFAGGFVVEAPGIEPAEACSLFSTRTADQHQLGSISIPLNPARSIQIRGLVQGRATYAQH